MGFFTPVNYRGAFGGDNWLNGWTYLSKKGYLTGLPDVGSDSEGGSAPFADADNDGISDDLEATQDLIDLGFTVGADDSSLFGSIYTESSILDLTTGGQVMIQGGGNGGNTTLSLPLFRSSDMSVFTAAPALEATFTGAGEKEFYRIQVTGAE